MVESLWDPIKTDFNNPIRAFPFGARHILAARRILSSKGVALCKNLLFLEKAGTGKIPRIFIKTILKPPIRSKIGWKTAAGLVIANMIGTGVFTSLGFQLSEVQNTWSILLLWTIGGGMALIGAFVYAELGTFFQRTGGDYIFLSETIHPAIGYCYAWISLTVGFSAPIAIAAMAMNDYLHPVLGLAHWPGHICLLGVPLVHLFSVKRSGQ